MNPEQETASPAKVSPATLRLTHVIAPALILLLPFVSYVRYHDYGLWRPEILISVAAIIALGLVMSGLAELLPNVLRPFVIVVSLILFMDLQESFNFKFSLLHWLILSPSEPPLTDIIASLALRVLVIFLMLAPMFIVLRLLRPYAGLITSTVFGVALIATVLLPVKSLGIGASVNNVDTNPNADLPLIIHLVLDEHIGIEGLPSDIPGGKDLRRELKAFYQSNGFALFGRAFSHYARTVTAMPSLLNGQSIVQSDTYEILPRMNRKVLKNAWFRQLANQGYRIRVYQSDFMDYCDNKNVNIDFCYIYPADSIHSLIDADLGLGNKIWLTFLDFLRSSLLFQFVRSDRGLNHQPYPGVSGNSASGRNWINPIFGSLTSLKLIDRISADIKAAPAGTVFFAHLMIPHFSLVYEDDCGLRSNLATWYNRNPWLSPPPPRLRVEGYSRYFSQIRCIYRKLGGLLRRMENLGILKTATVIIHGDHGSRLWLVPSRIQNAARVSDQDIIDGFSTLFAVRTPTLRPGYDRRMRSIQSLFAEIGLGRPALDDHQDIFLENPDKQGTYLRRPMVRFGDRDASGTGMGK